MIYAILIPIGVFLYAIGIGVSSQIMDKRYDWCREDSVWVSVFIWWLLIPWVIGEIIMMKIVSKPQSTNKIIINKGARIENLNQYQSLKKLCDDFEIRETAKEIEKELRK